MLTGHAAAQAKSAFEAAIAVDHAEIALGRQVRDTTGNKKALVAAAKQLVRLSRQATTVAFGLVGGVDENIEADRTAQLALAVQYRDGMLAESIKTARIALVLSGTTDALPFLDEVSSRMAALDLVLEHSDPPMEPAQATGRRTCIGPHGDYYKSQRLVHLAIHYWREWADHWVAIFAATAGKRFELGEAFGLYAHCTTMQHQAGALLAGISLYWKWDTLDPFCKVLKATELLTRQDSGEGTPSVYFAFMDTWAKVASSSLDYQRSLVRYADSWAKNEVWELMVFPNITRCPR